MEHITKIASLDENGVRLDRCLRIWAPHLPQSLIEKAARKGLLKIDGLKAKPRDRVAEGQTISFPNAFVALTSEVPTQEPLVLTAAERKWLKDLILYQDEDLIVLNKPAGIAVQGGTNQTRSLDAMMKVYDDTSTPRLVHRLDQETSGVLVFARTLPMARWLTEAFRMRKIQKTYWAIVCGVPDQREGIISLPLSKKPEGEKIRVNEAAGLPAITSYHIIETFENQLTLLELTPETGRTHQLRVHLAEGLKTPILGDGKYGGKAAFPYGRTPLHLHARALTFSLPNGKSMTMKALLPLSFQKTFKTLNKRQHVWGNEPQEQ